MADQPHALVRYDGPRSVDDLIRYAAVLASNAEGNPRRNEALPVHFRDNPAAIAFVTEYAKALDVSPVTAIMGVHLIDGKLAASSGLISALVRRAGHKIRTWVEGTVEDGNLKGITTIIRGDDPDFEYRSEWTIGRAVRAELCTTTLDPTSGRWTISAPTRNGKAGNWEKFPENMAKARSITECARDAAEDAILGVHYTPEELGAEVDESGEPVYTVTQVPTREDPPARPNDGSGPSGRFYKEPETPPAETPPVPEGTPTDTDAKVDAAGDAAVELADQLRREILAAQSRDDLAAIWRGPLLGNDRQTAKSSALVCGDENGQETNVLELFNRQAAAISAGNPLVDDPGPAFPEAADDPARIALRDGGRDVTLDEALAAGRSVPGANLDPVAGRGDTKGRAETAAHPNRTALSRVLGALTESQVDAVVDYCRINSLDPANGEEDCAAILEEITLGNTFRNDDAPADPEALVRDVLGGTVVERTPVTDPAEIHRRTLAERDAARAENHEETTRTAREHGRPPGTGREAFSKARGRKATDQ